ncbi:site-specific DNA-methyltransferase [Gemella morbillorum]|uniref:site-specific DNA-methyltransferase n=3 Tax=Gemella morbillorum TaxID=29391 RepID=UPI0035660333
MEKMRMESLNLTSQNVEKIEALFPNCITESRDENGKLKKSVNFKMLKQILSEDIVDGEEVYEFTWVGKKESIVEANKPVRKTLRPAPEESVDWENTENLYIEGDNLEVLKLLQESYLGQVKMIYIDPPYNTGNDFIYNDDFKVSNEEYAEESGEFDENGNRMFKNTDSNGRFHSDWCSMIYSRLLVAKNLLREDGVVFISIDDNEVENLKKLCNEIFGELNFRNQILVRRRIKSLNAQFADSGLKSFNVGYEYVLIYSKSSSFLFKPLRVNKEKASEKGSWNVFWSNADRPTMRYELLGFTPETGQWRWKREAALKAIENYNVYLNDFSEKMTLEEYNTYTNGKLNFVRRIENGIGKNGGVQYWVAPSDTALRTSNWTDLEVSQIAKDIDLGFTNPKNIRLIKEFLKTDLGSDSIILDFFSGSATTAHAVMELNAEDNGNRKFIMVQLPEETDEKSEAHKAGYKNICEIGKERIRRAGDKIKGENLLLTANLDTGFRVFKIDSSNMKDVYYSPSEITQDFLSSLESNIKEDRTDLDLLFGCLVEWGLPLSLPYKSIEIDGCLVHNYNEGDLIACFEENISENVMQEIAKLTPLRVVFRDSSFENSAEKINTSEIFKLLSPDTKIKVI